MPTILDENGLQIANYDEIKQDLEEKFKSIYGNDINLDSNTPDGQLIGILSQQIYDLLLLLQDIYNSFSVDSAIGKSLDNLVALNNLKRRGGSYTITPVAVTANAPCTLYGLDQNNVTPFTVADQNGNEYYLVETYNFVTAGTQNLNFRAKETGEINPTLNSIINIITVKSEIDSVTNTSPATTIGSLQETDYELRVRRNKSFGIASQGFLQSLYGALYSVKGVSTVLIFENNSDTIDSYGIPPHSIYVVVEGGEDEEIAQQIYEKRNAGCGMHGSTQIDIEQIDGSIFTVKFDRPENENAYIRMRINPIGSYIPNINYIKQKIVENLVMKINDELDVSDVIAAVRLIDENVYLTDVKVSKDGSSWQDIIYPSNVNKRFVLATSRIIVL